jgi:hypothetical protein
MAPQSKQRLRADYDRALLAKVRQSYPQLGRRKPSAIIELALNRLIDGVGDRAPVIEAIVKKHPHLAGLPERALIEAGLYKLLDADPIPVAANLVRVPVRSPLPPGSPEQEAQARAGLQVPDLD